MTRVNPLSHPGWLVRLAAGLLCLAVAMPAGMAWAQQSGPSVVITGVDSRSFPTITANLTVTGSNGLPLVGLTTDNFTIQEDGNAVPAGTVVLSSDISQQLNLVLAFDISVDPAGMAQMQAAATDFVASLGPADQVAILSFYDKVDLVQSFTSDKGLLTTDIKNLTPGGNATVFNQATDEAVNMLAALPAGRKALIIMTNSGDTTTNPPPPQPTITKAQAAQVRIYPFGFTANVNPKLMTNWAKFTGGQAYLLPSADEIRPNLLTLGVLLRQSYRLSFKSGLKADNKTHALTVALNYQGQTGQAQATFTALPGQITVTGPGITNGQTVRGMVFLIAEVTSPAPISSVAFLLDGTQLANLTSPPYRFDWDTTTALPGIHTLMIKATDQVGNVGQSQVSVNVVLPPPAVVTAAPAATPTPAPLGGGQVQAFAARATGVLGRVAAGLALLVALIVALLLWLRSLAAQRQVQVKTCAVEVSNQGNVRSRYEIRAEDPSGMLKFEFMLDDTDLAQRAGEPVDARAGVAQAAPREKPGAAAVTQVKGVMAKATALETKAVDTVNRGSTITTWIVNISYILPGSLGDSLRGATSGLFATQYQVGHAVDAPGRFQRTVTGAAPPRELRTGDPNSPLNLSSVQGPSSKSTTSGNGAATAQATAAARAKPVARSGWSLTPPVDAGAALTIQMKVRPNRRPKSRHYDFQVLSRSVDGSEDTPVIDHGSVALRGASMRRVVLSWLLLGIALVLLVLLAAYVLATFNIIHLG